MAFVGYEQVVVTSAIQTVSALTVPANATHAELQAETNHIRYRMDGGVPGSSSGMLLVAGSDPRVFLIEEVRNIQFVKDAGSPKLNVHYWAGRNV